MNLNVLMDLDTSHFEVRQSTSMHISGVDTRTKNDLGTRKKGGYEVVYSRKNQTQGKNDIIILQVQESNLNAIETSSPGTSLDPCHTSS